MVVIPSQYPYLQVPVREPLHTPQCGYASVHGAVCNLCRGCPAVITVTSVQAYDSEVLSLRIPTAVLVVAGREGAVEVLPVSCGTDTEMPHLCQNVRPHQCGTGVILLCNLAFGAVIAALHYGSGVPVFV